jgi:ATP-dependent protease ClpP protease subunit
MKQIKITDKTKSVVRSMNHQKIRREIKDFFKTVSIEKLTKDFEKFGYEVVDENMIIITDKTKSVVKSINSLKKRGITEANLYIESKGGSIMPMSIMTTIQNSGIKFNVICKR